MKHSYMLDIIRVFTQEERQGFSNFLDSGFVNKGHFSNDLKHLYQLVLQSAPEFPDELVEKKRVYEQLFPGKEFVEGKLDKLMTELSKWLRTYALIQRQVLQNTPYDNQMNWANWLRERGLETRFEQSITKLKSEKVDPDSTTLDHYLRAFKIAEMEHISEMYYNRIKGDLNIPEAIRQLDLYYFNYRTELLNRFLLQQKAAKLPENELVNIAHQQLPPGYYLQESPLLMITQKIHSLLMAEEPSIEAFQNLMQSLLEHEKLLTSTSMSQLYTYLRSYCTLLIDNGKIEFIPVLHLLHKDNLARGFLFIDGKLGPNAYLNIVQIALRTHAVDWALEFTETYRHQIHGGDNPDFFYQLNLANCLFAMRRFEEALDVIPETSSGSFYHLLTRRLELKTYYELHSDLLSYKIDAFRKFIERTAPKNVASDQKTLNINFVNILMQLSQIPPKDQKRSVRLIERIQAKKLISERTWLLEKARELAG